MVRNNPLSSDSEINYSDTNCETTSEKSTRTLRSRNKPNTKKNSEKVKKSQKQISDEDSSDLSDFQDKKFYTRPKNKRNLKRQLTSEESEDTDLSKDSNSEEDEEEERPQVKKSTTSREKVNQKKSKTKKKKRPTKKEKNVGRRKIKQIITEDDLNQETKNAEIEEEKRRKRLKEREGEKMVEVDLNDSIPLIDPIPITKKFVLQKEPFVEVHPEMTIYLKPHQVEGIQFIWDNFVENTSRAEADNGGGCILAHCMGLGKTLQTITSIHTIFHCKYLSLKTALIVAPLNTLLNWVDEFHKWCPDDQPIKVYNLGDCPTKRGRLNLLKEWKKNGGAMILGYDLFRILATGVGIKYKPWRTAFAKLLLDPGPDIVVCDEGHKLKNSGANISLVMNKINTRRRLVLTGTPLQNNLIEYQCMVNFVKPNLLGSIKEFRNRFVNPILNGQHSDSTIFDVKLMKKRCHILHEMLQGFVQRKDYTALAEYLCDKKEYILKVRLSNEQIDLYQCFLNTKTNRGQNPNAVEKGSRDTGLFADYQNLLRIWTHPRILQLHTIREVKRANLKMEESSDEAMSTDHEYTPNSPKKENKVKENGAAANTKENNGVIMLESSDEESQTSSKLPPKKSRRIEMSSDENDGDDGDQSEEWEGTELSSKEEEEGSEEEESSEEEEEEVEVVKKPKSRNNRYRMRIKETEEVESMDENDEFEDEWFSSILPTNSPAFDKVEAGGKVAVLFEILRLAKEQDDKVLVFSQSLLSLDLIEEMLQLSTVSAESKESAGEKDHHFEKWYKNVDYYRMDGSSGGKTRQRCINDFNSEEDRRGRLFLISTKAGSLGVNLVAANRVVIFDASWNPSHDIQSIFRVYRFGQTKCCYIYRLVAQGTMEEKIYDRQVAKQSLAFRVVDEQQINRHFTANDLQELYQFYPSRIPEESEEKTKHVLPEDDLLADILRSSHGKYISSYHKHDSLLDHQEAEELTEEERKAAWDEYENEKKGLVAQRNVFFPLPNNGQAIHFTQVHNNSSLMVSNPFGVGAVPLPPSVLPQLKISQEELELNKYMATSHFMDPLIGLPSEQQELAKKIFILMFQKKQRILELQAKSNLLQPLDKDTTIASIKSMPIYKSLSDNALTLVFFDLQMKQRQALNNIKKEIKPHEAELNWLQTKYRTLLSVNKDSIMPNNKDLPSTSNTTREQPVTSQQEKDKKSDFAEASKFARNSFANMLKVKPATDKDKKETEISSKEVQFNKMPIVLLQPCDRVTKEVITVDSE